MPAPCLDELTSPGSAIILVVLMDLLPPFVKPLSNSTGLPFGMEGQIPDEQCTVKKEYAVGGPLTFLTFFGYGVDRLFH